MAPAGAPFGGYRALARSFEPPPFTMVDGETTTLAGAFVEPPPRTIEVSIDLPSFLRNEGGLTWTVPVLDATTTAEHLLVPAGLLLPGRTYHAEVSAWSLRDDEADPRCVATAVTAPFSP